jgi:BirA family biotin operon repressor/biotin-[acetyl-CoA-carboxylase] ligase
VGLERAVEAAKGTLAGGTHIEIKWPNDLLVGGRKLAGILVEARKIATPRGAIEAAVVGIGVNVAQGPADFPPELGRRGISLFEAAGLMLDRLRVVDAVLASLDDHLVRERSDEWLAPWKHRCGMLGRRVTARQGGRVITGQVLDIDPLHGLIVRDDQGATHLLSARTCSIA